MWKFGGNTAKTDSSLTVNNGNVAETPTTGSFKRTDVPPRTYNVKVWHETLEEVNQKVTVKPSDAARVTFELVKK